MERSRVLEAMGELKLYGMCGAYDEILATAVKRQHEPQRVVSGLLEAEINEKQARSIKYQMTVAKLPLAKDIDAGRRLAAAAPEASGASGASGTKPMAVAAFGTPVCAMRLLATVGRPWTRVSVVADLRSAWAETSWNSVARRVCVQGAQAFSAHRAWPSAAASRPARRGSGTGSVPRD